MSALLGEVLALPVAGAWGTGRVVAAVAGCGLALAAVLLGLASPAAQLRRLARLSRAVDPAAGRAGPRAVGPAGSVGGSGYGGRSGGRSGGRWQVLVEATTRLLGAHPDASPLRSRLAIAAVSGVGVLVLTTLADALSPESRLVGAVMGGLVCLVVAGRLEPSAARARRLQAVVDLPHLLDLLAAALRAGLPLRVAVGEVAPLVGGPLAEALDQVLRQVDLGVPEAVAWRTLREHPALGRLALDLARSVDSGLRLSATLAHHATDARRSRQAALTAGARSVGVHSVPPLMVCFLPAFLLIGVVPTGVSSFLHALG